MVIAGRTASALLSNAALAQHLQGRPAIRDVIPAPWAHPGEFDRTVAVRILHCQGHDDGVVRLTANWEVSPANSRGRGTFSGAWKPGDIPGLVNELDVLVGQLADAIQADL